MSIPQDNGATQDFGAPYELKLVFSELVATQEFARKLGGTLRRGDVIALRGTLGAGKTAFARALIHGLQAPLGVLEDVPSPTFSLVQQYPVGALMIWHFDCYRLSAPQEAYELGIEEAFADGVSLIEWPEKLEALLPSCRLDVFLSAEDPLATRRTARLVAHEEWASRLAQIVPPARIADA